MEECRKFMSDNPGKVVTKYSFSHIFNIFTACSRHKTCPIFFLCIHLSIQHLYIYLLVVSCLLLTIIIIMHVLVILHTYEEQRTSTNKVPVQKIVIYT